MKKHIGFKGQVSTEYLLSMAFLLVVVAIIAGYSFITYQETIKVHSLNSSLSALGSAAGYVHAAGSGNSILTKIILPEGISSAIITSNTITITWKGIEFTNTLDFNLSGSIPIAEGTYAIRVYSNGTTVAFQAI